MILSTKRKINLSSIVIRTIAYLALFLLAIFSILHIPAVQNYILNTVVGKVTSSINGDVEIGNSEINIYSGITISDIQLINDKEEVLLNLDELKITPRSTLIALMSSDLSLNDITLTGARLYLNRREGRQHFNWEEFLGLDTQKDNDQGTPPKFDLNSLRLNDFEVEWNDELRKEYLQVCFSNFEIDLDRLDLNGEDPLAISRLLLIEPNVYYDREILPATDSTTLEETTAYQKDKGSVFPFQIRNMEIVDGTMFLQRHLSEPLEASNLDLLVKNVRFDDLQNWQLEVDKISGATQRDRIPYAAIELVNRSEDRLSIENAIININNSRIRFDGQADQLESFSSAGDASYELEMNSSIVYLQDAFTLLPGLEREFAGEPLASKEIQLDGYLQVQGNKYIGRDLFMWLNGRHSFAGNVSFEKAETLGESLLNANVLQLTSELDDLSQLSSKFVIPKDLVRLKTVNFQGSFDGYLNDFVANGLMTSPLGLANMDIKFDFSGSDQEAISYEGFLSLDSFDLKSFTLNDDFGIVKASVDITNGTGKDLSSSTADIRASIQEFEFKDFLYSNANYEGRLSSRIIDGQFKIEDDELDFEFSGVVDFSDSLPIFDFNINADKINFCQLNIVDFPCEISFNSDINLKGNSISNLDGIGILNDIQLTHDTTDLFLNQIKITSNPNERSNQFTIRSDYVDLDLIGKFNLITLTEHMIAQLAQNLKTHNDIWKIPVKDHDLTGSNYVYNLVLKNSTPIFRFLGEDIEQKGFARFSGQHRALSNNIEFSAFMPFLSYNELSADSIRINLSSEGENTVFSSQLQNFKRGSTEVELLSFHSDFLREDADWTLTYILDQFNNAEIHAQSSVEQDGYITNFLKDEVRIDSVIWNIVSDHGVGIYSSEIDLEGFTLSDGNRYVSLKDVNQRGLEISMNDFALDFINPIINYDKTIFSGTTDGQIRINDVFKDRSLYGFVEVPDFKINGDDFGHLVVRAERSIEYDSIINLNLSIEKDTQNLYAKGFFDLANNFLETNIEILDYPMNFFEYIIDDGISETVGTTDINALIRGPLSDLTMSGGGIIKDAGVRIDYIGAYYRMDSQRVTLDENYIDFTDVELIDELDHIAVITGGLKHNLLADIRADLSISSDRFIGLNTTYDDNPIYYGQGIGKLDVTFDGPFDAIDIVVNGTLEELSRLSIPLTSTSYVYDKSFIVFDSNQDTTSEEDSESLAEILKDKGVDFELNLTFTPDATVTIIYDEVTSNVLEGTGEGNIKLEVKRDGAFNAYGRYTINSGRYLYTAYGFIAKPFIIRSGGTVTWTGDPLNATLDVTADHQGLRAPLTNFLGEYIGTSGVQDADLSFSRDVDLILLLSGTLFEPTVNFDIDFPNITGQLRTLAQNKVRTLRATENGINNQVVGLLLFRNFLPDNNGLAAVPGATVGASGNNTITQFLTSQLSLMASDYLSSKLGDNDFISAIDFEIAVAQNTSILGDDAGVLDGFFDVVPDEVQLNLRNRFKNENFVLNLGGNYVRESQLSQAENFVTGDFSLDWYLTDDRRLKLRFYGNYDYDEAFSTRRQRYGFGINYRKEFGSMTNVDFQEVLDDLIEELKQESVTGGK